MRTMLSFSGGLDSTVLLAETLRDGEVMPVNFYYGSKHNHQERHAAHVISNIYGLSLIEVNLDFSFFKSVLLSGDVPEGAYDSEVMRQTVVPFRNGIMLSYLAGLAESLDCEGIAIAAHSGDHHIYPDCRPEFLEAMSEAINLGTYKKIKLFSPFSLLSKADIVKKGSELGAPMESSWTCYKGGQIHCGKCGSCDERKWAFKTAGVKDFTKYEV